MSQTDLSFLINVKKRGSLQYGPPKKLSNEFTQEIIKVKEIHGISLLSTVLNNNKYRLNTDKYTLNTYIVLRKMLCHQAALLLLLLSIVTCQISLTQSLLLDDINNNKTISQAKSNSGQGRINNSTGGSNNMISAGNSNSPIGEKDYLEKLNNFERSVAAVLIKVAYGTTSTTKRSIPDSSYSLGLTTVATPFLTTQRYPLSIHHQQPGVNHQKNYELDLERDHALPTSAPNADILKSNNNPTYPNPNRHSSHTQHERDRHRQHYNSTPNPAIPNLFNKKANNGLAHSPTIPMYPGDHLPSYSPPSRSFFTPPLPPEYQNPFADKPTLRGTNNEGLIGINRRPIPPPSLMPSQDRIPIRPPELGGNNDPNPILSLDTNNPSIEPSSSHNIDDAVTTMDRKKALNTPARPHEEYLNEKKSASTAKNSQEQDQIGDHDPIIKKSQEVLPNIRRILGSNGKNGDIPAVLLKQVTQRPNIISIRNPPSSPIVLIEKQEKGTNQEENIADGSASVLSSNINQSKMDYYDNANQSQTTPSAAAAIGDVISATSSLSYATTNSVAKTTVGKELGAMPNLGEREKAHTTWSWAWNIHIYLSVVLFTILSVYSLYKLLTFNKLTHLFAQSYFICIHFILILICAMRIFFLCFDAYNVHGSFNIFAAELLLNLPSTFLTVAFSVLILFLFLKSLNHKNNRYSALIRPLTVVVGCGVHVVLCVTLHYVESYTLKNHLLYFQQQQQQLYFRRQLHFQGGGGASLTPPSSAAILPPPPRVLTLICQIIYIFICLSLGLLYLYLYRILKRILRSKSQNYIHGYQNLSYAIHITIATALLFVLMAVLQIFGAICIATSTRQMNIIDVDWLQWGYQFSLRLIEIAIITLITWVTGLKTSLGGNDSVTNNTGNVGTNDVRMVSCASTRDKHVVGNVAGVSNFFLPCTSSSSQEVFDTDYPAICNANTNLHTYTMRTGKLIYDDSYALNPMGAAGSSSTNPGNNGRSFEYQLQEPMYQRPYDTGSMNSQNLSEYHHGHVQVQNYHHKPHTMRYTNDSVTDHYENPNFNLKNPESLERNTAETCYSEPLEHENNKRFEFNIFERPVYKEKTLNSKDANNIESFQDHKMGNGRKLNGGTLERNYFDNTNQTHHTERRSSNSTSNSCSSSNGGNARYPSYNSYERCFFTGVRKSGTLSQIGVHSERTLEPSMVLGTHHRMMTNGAQTLGDRAAHYYQRGGAVKGRNTHLRSGTNSDLIKSIPIRERQLPYDHHNSDEEDDDEEEDDIISGNNVECTNLINNEGITTVTNGEDCTTNSTINDKSMITITSSGVKNNTNDPLLNSNKNGNKLRTASSVSVASASSNSCTTTSSASDSMLVADQGFLRFRSAEDQHNITSNGSSSQVVVDPSSASLSFRHQGCSATENGIDC
ncbi:uncharacterized protein [Drosophila kikkawai]|uniref:Uncharacterized protein isoform X2 n=1 Tax=Drosophila kikkawai TaxID=30033 RepID=A0A6P4JI87_DROKI|nr:uncharacterized protein LOC108083269 isoform X2 [Drosophila kikkawai]